LEATLHFFTFAAAVNDGELLSAGILSLALLGVLLLFRVQTGVDDEFVDAVRGDPFEKRRGTQQNTAAEGTGGSNAAEISSAVRRFQNFCEFVVDWGEKGRIEDGCDIEKLRDPNICVSCRFFYLAHNFFDTFLMIGPKFAG